VRLHLGEACVSDQMRTTVIFYGLMAVAAIAMGIAMYYSS
jgi:hypothetical protein